MPDDAPSQCGPGFQTRIVYCSKETSDEKIDVEVDDELCINGKFFLLSFCQKQFLKNAQNLHEPVHGCCCIQEVMGTIQAL